MMRKIKPMFRRSSTSFAVGIALAASVGPVAAQNPFEFLFGRGSSAPAQAPAQAPAAAAAPSGMPATAILPPKRPASFDDPATTQAVGRTAAPAPETRPLVTAATPAAAPAATPGPASPLGEKQIVDR